MSASRQFILASAGLALACAVPTAARADVIEIRPDGAQHRLSGPARHTAEGVAPILPAVSSLPDAPPVSMSDAARQRLAGARPLLEDAGGATAVSPRLLEAVAFVESRFRSDAVSPAGAVGMMQLMPAAAGDLGVDPARPEDNVRGGAAYLRQQLDAFNGDLALALAAYNAGPAAVRRHGGVPPYPETRAYVAAVLSYLAETVEAAP